MSFRLCKCFPVEVLQKDMNKTAQIWLLFEYFPLFTTLTPLFVIMVTLSTSFQSKNFYFFTGVWLILWKVWKFIVIFILIRQYQHVVQFWVWWIPSDLPVHHVVYQKCVCGVSQWVFVALLLLLMHDFMGFLGIYKVFLSFSSSFIAKCLCLKHLSFCIYVIIQQ